MEMLQREGREAGSGREESRMLIRGMVGECVS